MSTASSSLLNFIENSFGFFLPSTRSELPTIWAAPMDSVHWNERLAKRSSWKVSLYRTFWSFTSLPPNLRDHPRSLYVYPRYPTAATKCEQQIIIIWFGIQEETDLRDQLVFYYEIAKLHNGGNKGRGRGTVFYIQNGECEVMTDTQTK